MVTYQRSPFHIYSKFKLLTEEIISVNHNRFRRYFLNYSSAVYNLLPLYS
jgi:hypothetical protein